jgi:hypothetical protein
LGSLFIAIVRINHNSINNGLQNKLPLLRRATERHSGFKQSREQRRAHGSLPILRPAGGLIGKTTGMIKSVIERFGNSPEIAPAKDFGQPDKYL